MGPTFVAKFSDSEITRMTTYCPTKLDLGRGIRLSQAAYKARTGRSPPAIVEGHFENHDGEILKRYGIEDLTKHGALAKPD
jgi:hypothetical protein